MKEENVTTATKNKLKLKQSIGGRWVEGRGG